MIAGLAFTLLTGVLWTLVGVVCSRAAERREGFCSFMLFNALVFMLISWIFRTPSAAPPGEVLKIAVLILPAAVFGQLGFLALYGAMRSGPHGVAWGISQAAMIFPFLAGWLGFGNSVGIPQLAGIALLLGALPLLGKGKGGSGGLRSGRFLLFCAAALCLIGAGQVLTLLPNQCEVISEAALSWRVPLYSLGGLGWGVPVLLGREKFRPNRLRDGALYGGVVAAGQITLYLAIDRMSGVRASEVVYPIAIGGCIVFFFLYCRIWRKEKSSATEFAGIGMLVPGLFLLALR